MVKKTRGKKKTTKDVPKKRVVLLDSHAIIHRAYHALPDFSSSRGEPTGALYGLTAMLLKIIETLDPQYLIAGRDLAGPTHRHDVYEAYKATRVKTEDALVLQLEKCGDIFSAFGIPLYEAPGFEADDILGTIVEKLRSDPSIEIIIATGDLDTLQLVSGERVRVFTMRTGISDTVIYDEETVNERYGFGPELVPDLKGIMGDPSDNIKGVPGVGEGSALKLIRTYGSIEAIYKAIKKKGVERVAAEAGIQKRFAKIMEENEDAAVFSKMLATIRRDAPITFSLPEREWSLTDHLEGIRTMCTTYEFKTLKERVRILAHKRGGSEEEREEEVTRASEDIAPDQFEETAVALWLLRSDLTNPTLDDIARYTKAKNFEGARTAILKELHETGSLKNVFEMIEKPLIPIIRRMHADGVRLDVAFLKGLAQEYSESLKGIAARIYGYAGREFNVYSPRQLGIVLFDELKLSLPKQKKTATGVRTTKEEELLKMKDQHPIIEDVLQYRELQKLLSTYVENLPTMVSEDGRLHAKFLQAGTTTGRMSSEAPNLQNIPIRTEYGRRVRSAFIPAPGYLIASLDYSQIELRIAAGLSGDEKLIRIFKKGGDVHAAVAAEVFNVPPDKVDPEMRRRAKIINFGILYGMGVNALRANLGESVSREQASDFLQRYFEDFPGLARYIEDTKKSAARLGYTETYFGRRRYFAGFNSPLPNMRAQAERMAINAPIQGTQADIIKLAMVRADALIEKKTWRGDVKLLMQVHDELVYEIRADKADEIVRAITETMNSVLKKGDLGGVPIVTSAAIGENWGVVQKIKL